MIISRRVQSGVQRRRHISVQIQLSPTAFLVFTPGADPKATRLNLNRRGCVIRFVAAMVTALLFTSVLTFKIALFRTGYPFDCFDTHTLAEILFIYPLLIFRWKQPPDLIRSKPQHHFKIFVQSRFLVSGLLRKHNRASPN